MTDTFNLVPTNNLEKHLDNILRAASGEEPQYDLAPNWRVEQYLAAIASALASGGGGGGGGVLVVHEVDGALDKTYKQIVDALHANGVILEWTHENGAIEVYMVVDYGKVDSVYSIAFHTDSVETSAGGESHYYVAESENSYPTNDD